MSTIIEMTSGLSFSEIRHVINTTIGTNFGYDLRCQDANGSNTHIELEVLGLEDEAQEELTRLFVNEVRPILSNYFAKFEIVQR